MLPLIIFRVFRTAVAADMRTLGPSVATRGNLRNVCEEQPVTRTSSNVLSNSGLLTSHDALGSLVRVRKVHNTRKRLM